MTWRDPKSGEKRLDRGTEWFLMRDGKIAEVRAYHHGDKKNPQGDLLGFDHAGARLHDARGLERRRDRASSRTPAERALLPPFTDEHEELRESVRRFVSKEIAPARRRVGGGARVPARALHPLRRARLPRAQVRDRARRPGRRLRPRRGLGRGALALRRQRRGRRRARRPHRDRDAADLEVRHRGAEAALARARDHRRDDRRARDHRARRRLRRRLDPDHAPARSTAATSSTARRPSSPTASAPTSSSAP